jgi:hypothetical protein
MVIVNNQYLFADFTLDNYKRLLKLAKQNYSFHFFTDEYFKKSILLRHDLEFSIPIALKMAIIEADLGINATYFVQLHSEFYNTLEKDTINTVKEILELNHQVGLHFDSHYWSIDNEAQLEKYIMIDKVTLEQYIGADIKVFSFHNNTPFTLSCRRNLYGELLNVYSNYFRNNYSYNADSLGYWRFERLEERLKEAKEDSLHVLIHDGLWQNEVLPPRRRVFKVIDDRATYLKQLYDSFLASKNLKNIDWDGGA